MVPYSSDGLATNQYFLTPQQRVQHRAKFCGELKMGTPLLSRRLLSSWEEKQVWK